MNFKCTNYVTCRSEELKQQGYGRAILIPQGIKYSRPSAVTENRRSCVFELTVVIDAVQLPNSHPQLNLSCEKAKRKTAYSSIGLRGNKQQKANLVIYQPRSRKNRYTPLSFTSANNYNN